jgi:C4-dicarboxylate-specific signal transduction histidine kinase
MLAQLDQDAQAAAESRALTLDSILDRQRAVATVLAVDQQVIQLLQQGGPDRDFAVSAKMDLLRAETQSDVIYLLDRRGVSVAASNWDLPSSFIGHDYGFRQYFRQSVAQGTGQEYALGTVSGRPGLYLAHDIRDGTTLLGVVVVKVEFDPLEAAWARDTGATHVVDGQDRVIISGQPALRFGALPDVRGMVQARASVRGTDWTLLVRRPLAEAQRVASLAAGTAVLAVLLAGVVVAVIQASLMLTASRRRTSAMDFALPDLPPDLAVRAEAVRLEQILVNLLTNAHDAQEGRTDPRIAIAVQADDARVTLTIRDNGPGLSSAMAAQLFTPFATDKPQGLGLGLVISRDIARDFGGELDALPPEPGQGAAFRLTLPRAA